MKPASILVVDDEPSIREAFNLILSDKYKVIFASTAEAALKQVADNPIDLVFLDVRMPGISGIESLQKFKKIDPGLNIIMVTAVNDMQKAGSAIKNGAREYIVKPFDINHIMALVEKVLEEKDSSLNIQEIYSFEEEKNTVDELVGQSEKIKFIKEQIQAAAQTNQAVFIRGEIGTEKNAVARLIHKNSLHNQKSFKEINIPKNAAAKQIDSLLFGSASGQNTSTLDKEEGLVDEIRGGTLFINHVENLAPSLQEKLFEFISSPQNFENRFIFASEKEKIDSSLSRIIKIQITLPPLRERTTDIPHLVNYLMAKFSRKYGKIIKGATKETLDILQNYPWRNNNEELKNTLELAFIYCDGELISVSDLPFSILARTAEAISREEIKNLSLSRLTQEIEKKIIQNTLKKSRSEKSAAQEMEITPAVLNLKREILSV